MPLRKIQFRPGINREVTDYTNELGWYDCNLVRFVSGFPESLGGWTLSFSRQLLGVCRGIRAWVTVAGTRLLAFGTSNKLLLSLGGGLYDITPLRETTAAGDVTFSATNGSSEIEVTDTSHGAAAGDFVTFSGAATLGGLITADVLNQEYRIKEVTASNTYTIDAREAGVSILDTVVDGVSSPTLVTANASDTGNGGASVVGAYQIAAGNTDTLSGSGWGIGTWGRGTWGSGTTPTALSNTLRHWSFANFGDDLIACPRDGGVFYWDETGGTGSRAVNITGLAGASYPPQIARQVMISGNTDRHVIAFGCDPQADPGNQDLMTIRVADRESVTDWGVTATNTAEERRLLVGSEFVQAVETRQLILAFTDSGVHAMQFIGPPFTFGLTLLSSNTTIRSPKAAVAADDVVYWMGKGQFYVYSGGVQQLPCTVLDYVFDDFNETQGDKVISGLNLRFQEVWWFYPSAASSENDRYVIYNYIEQTWYYGQLSRTAWLDRGLLPFPTGVDALGNVFDHEDGVNDGSANPSVALNSYVESSPLDITTEGTDGEHFFLVRRALPDVEFDGSTDPVPTVDLTLSVRNVSRGQYTKSQTKTFKDPEATSGTGSRTEQLFYRLRGRQMKVRLENMTRNVAWRLGSLRVDFRADGRR